MARLVKKNTNLCLLKFTCTIHHPTVINSSWDTCIILKVLGGCLLESVHWNSWHKHLTNGK